ncbi:DUF3617 family protein [Qipengyuania sp. DSG2-2]|uniref:DUF3617 family protein n=1 Tax=Qipengyuania sp. DGS2-2 TaxID=3349631 RepID=UPI0036D43CB0
MKSRLALVAAVPLILAACGDAPTEVDPNDAEAMAELADNMVKPAAGEYEVTSELIDFEISGLPKDQSDMMRGMMEGGFSQTTKYCLTEEEAEAGFEESIREMQSAQGECDYKKFAASGSSLEAEMTCNGPDGSVANMAMEGSLSETEQDITMTMDATSPEMPGDGMKMKMRMQSKRIGECAA